MKTRIATCIVSFALLAAANAQANDAHHPDAAAQKSAAAPKAATPGQSAQSTERFENVRRQLQKMLAQMDAIRETKDSAERQRLMDEHLRTMQETMQSMRAMGGPMMMGMMAPQGMGGAQNQMQSGKRGGAAMSERMDMMEKRMDMMQMMMEQMMQQQAPTTP
ncbi:hypothetical protein [Burkholderia ubonensis]|uniref:hypothetical protein n=1 Tax=Burkholderia ubonensis TaxID=101571 RepID=UPI000F565739|nr:hypothetical protein [Burkholderia ubonensis]RQP27733.1 hypothetical protein DF155_30920 [Burkholderia ubonensis]RQP29749.1 hypothetical protein DF154_32155 [Burkholderia ubonensis]RQP31905.1 hypothetical protein DF156_31140 [Burkholderia ubonensis]RQP47848.1 hypothetical protein DF144_30845 [Burkholderia ubonensis]RQP50865.1 hypothetical protein DF151_30740 [Burkholderia ubonensis]